MSVDHGPLLAVTERTKAVVICNPNDPTGSYVPSSELGALLSALPEHVFVLLDEALIHFQDLEDLDAGIRLVDAFLASSSSARSRRSTACRGSAPATRSARMPGCSPPPRRCSA